MRMEKTGEESNRRMSSEQKQKLKWNHNENEDATKISISDDQDSSKIMEDEVLKNNEVKLEEMMTKVGEIPPSIEEILE